MDRKEYKEYNILFSVWTKKKTVLVAVNETVAAWAASGGENVLHVMEAANATTYMHTIGAGNRVPQYDPTIPSRGCTAWAQ
jgi:hypothetical protein